MRLEPVGNGVSRVSWTPRAAGAGVRGRQRRGPRRGDARPRRLKQARVEALVDPDDVAGHPDRHLGRAAARGRHARRRRGVRRAPRPGGLRPAPDRRAAHEVAGLPGPAQLVPAPQAGDRADARARHRGPGAAVQPDLQAGLGPARRRRRGQRGTARSRSPARSRRSWRSTSTRAGWCSPTGCRRGAAGTTRSAWSSTAASTTPRWPSGSCPQAREIRTARFCTLAEVHHLCADFTARRIDSALAGLDGRGTAVHASPAGRSDRFAAITRSGEDGAHTVLVCCPGD